MTYISPEGVSLDNEFTFEYLPWRGVSKETMAFYDVKTKVSPNGLPLSLAYPYPNGSSKVRQLDGKAFSSLGEIGKAGLFGRDKFTPGSHKYVTITEGELDALSLRQVLQAPVVSVQSAATAVRDCTVERSWLNSYERIYIAFDSDEPGREAARLVARLFDYNKVYLVRFDPRKDANDWLQLGLGTELKNLWWASKKYKPDNIICSFSDFEKILQEKQGIGVPYPFPSWNEMLYGIRRGETVLITAPEGVGKTQVMHAIEYQLLKETDDAIGSIFLEEPKKRHIQAIAGLEIGQPVHLPDSPISEADVFLAFKKAVGSDERLHLYNHFGSDDPRVLEDTVRFLVCSCGVVYVLLDHIGMVVSGLGGEDERQALDYLDTRLTMMTQELNFGLIKVSHVNDFGETRGSRLIAKNANIRIDLKRDVKSPDPVIGNTTEVMVAKNRFSHKTGPANSLWYDTNSYKYSEIANAA